MSARTTSSFAAPRPRRPGPPPLPVPAALPVPTLRPASVADLPALAQLLVRCSPRARLGWSGRGGSVLPLAQQEAWLAEPGAVVVEAEPGRLLAVAALRAATCSGEEDPIAASVELLVQDAWQRRGLGSAVLRHLAAASHASGRSAVQASPHADPAAAAALLADLAERLGTRPRGQRHPHGRCVRVLVSDRTAGGLATEEVLARSWPG